MPWKPCRRSEAWSHFVVDVDEPKIAVCRHCKKTISFSGGNTGNLTRHLKKKHPSVLSTPNLERKFASFEDNSLQGRMLDLEAEDMEDDNDKEEEEDELGEMGVFRRTANEAHYSQGTTAHRGLASSLQAALLKLDELVLSNQDEFSIFGTYIASQLKKLPLESALKCQQEIQAMLTQERLDALKNSEETSFYYITEEKTDTVRHSGAPIIQTLQISLENNQTIS